MKQKRSKMKRRWVKTRPGSVLILVIALLVLLALIGTAYLSSTQTERYSAQQNSVNTEADLLVQGVIDAAQSAIANSLFASTGNGVQYRPPSQESWTYPLVNGLITPTAPPGASGYTNYDHPSTDAWLADRHPVNYSTNTAAPNPYWNAISWPLFTDGSGDCAFDSPFDGSANMFLASNKAQLQAYPTYKFVNNQTFPGMIYYMAPSATTIQGSGLTQTSGNCTLIQVQPTDTQKVTGVTLQSPTGPLYVQNSTYGVYITPLGLERATSFNQTIPSSWVNYGASASGDGISDGGVFKLPVGQINNVTYYASIRVIDNNSAVNVSSAWTSSTDPAATNIAEPLQPYNGTPGTGNSNLGYFPSGIGLREMLQSGTVANEMNALNAYRFNGILPSTSGTPASPTLYNQPIQDETPTMVTRSDFKWSSGGDAFMHQLIARPGNPGYSNASPLQQFTWLGESASAALAYRFDLRNPNASPSLIEQMLPAETYNNVQTTPYAPAQTTQWYNTNFNFSSATPQLRTILTGDNAVSNAIPSRLGNSSATTPVQWNVSSTYEFGDWVVNNGFSYVCLLHNAGNQPPVPYTVQGVGPEYWTQVPWTNQAVKTSLNTATFDQLWLGFCQTMTDSITAKGANNSIPLWQPPMMAPLQVSAGNYNEQQLQVFRSSIRDVRNLPISNSTPAVNTGNPVNSPTAATRLQLTPMQMMQLRAAIAAINALNMRNAPSDLTTRQVRSHHITLADNSGTPAYDVEVFGTDIQPYIGQMYSQVYTPSPGGPKAAPGTDAGSFIAIQLLNPYPVQITINSNWGFGTISRANYNNYIGGANAPLQVNSLLTGTLPTGMTIPAATANGPSSIVIYDYDINYDTTGNTPHAFQIPTTNGYRVQGLMDAIGKELVILKPRILNGTTAGGTLSRQTSAADNYNEGTIDHPNLYDLVPVDQLDMTGTDQYAKNNAISNQPMTYFLYKRAADPTATNSATHASYAWNFTWPGFYAPYNNKYNVISTTGTTTSFSPPPYAPYAQASGSYPFNQPIITFSVPPAQNSITFTNLTSGPASPTGGNITNPTYNTITLQLNNVGFPGPNPVNQGGNNMFPFGGFPRNVDILQVPYIGAYRISRYGTSPVTFYEMNSVTMDSSLANDSTLQPSQAIVNYANLYPYTKVLPTSSGYSAGAVQVTADSVADPFVEQIGRFCPIGDPNHTATTGLPDAMGQMDFGPGYDTTNPQAGTYWHYHWTRRLFNYFAVQAPHDDYFPNVDPSAPDVTAVPNIPVKYPGATNNPVTSSVLPVNNTQSIKPSSSNYYANAQIASKSEDTTGVQGLININTAPWPVLATLPFVPPNTDLIGYNNQVQPATLTPAFPTTIPGAPTAQANGVNDNIDLAKAIVDYRNQNGPFKSIMDLYKVPAFRLEMELLLLTDPGVALGDFSGGPTSSTLSPTPDGVRFDFEERYLLLNRVSNLITTRSDSFTCYVLLQGWRNAGTGNPSLAVERRVAFIIDRNSVTPANNKPAFFKVPNQ